MKLALLGVGNAGIRLVDELHGAEGPDNPISNGNVLLLNTTPSTFAETTHIDERRHVLIGDTHPEVIQPETDDRTVDEKTETEAAAETEQTDRREGVAGDPDLARTVAREDLPEIRRALDSVDDTEVDAAMIVAGLGGGTGSGVGSVLLEELKAIYEIPVYVLGVLPSNSESDQRAWSAARAIRTIVPMADAVFPVDNETWHEGDDDYATVNEAITERLLSLFGAGEDETKPLSELRMDPNDIRRTLDVGGVSTIGYVQTELEIQPDGWIRRLRRLLGFDVATAEARMDAVTIKSLVAEALESDLTLPCDISTADRVLLILSGPPKELSRKGFETGRSLLEDETGTVEILAGDTPDPDATAVTATLLLSNVTGVERIETLQQRALEFQATQDRNAAGDGPDDSDRSDDEPADEPDREADDKTDQSAETADDPGFQFEGDESVIKEAESTTDDTVDETAETVDETTETVDETANPDDDTDDETADESSSSGDNSSSSNDNSSSSDTARIKDPFADDDATTDEPAQ